MRGLCCSVRTGSFAATEHCAGSPAAGGSHACSAPQGSSVAPPALLWLPVPTLAAAHLPGGQAGSPSPGSQAVPCRCCRKPGSRTSRGVAIHCLPQKLPALSGGGSGSHTPAVAVSLVHDRLWKQRRNTYLVSKCSSQALECLPSSLLYFKAVS